MEVRHGCRQPIGHVPPTLGKFHSTTPSLSGRLNLSMISTTNIELPGSVAISPTGCRVVRLSLTQPPSPCWLHAGGPHSGCPRPTGRRHTQSGHRHPWLTILSAEDDPSFAELMNTQLDELEPRSSPTRAGCEERMAFVIVSSQFGDAGPLRRRAQPVDAGQGTRTLSIGRFESDAVRGTRYTGTGMVRTGGSRLYRKRWPPTP